MNRLEYPARVGHAVTHSATTGTLTLAAGGVIVGIVIVIVMAPEAVTVAVVGTATEAASGLATAGSAISEVAVYGKAGMTIGKWIDSFSAPSVAGHIVHGFPDVLLGPSVQPAARADAEDTLADCPGPAHGFEGSSTVFLGKEHRPMSRREDRLRCGGVICEGESSIIVGGAPSMEGKSIEEEDSTAVKWTGIGLDAMSVANPAFGKEQSWWRAMLGGTQVAAEATGHAQAADLIGAPTTKPSSLADAFNQFNDVNKSVTAAGKYASGSGGGSE